MSFLSALALLFIGLKLCGVIAWSWLWLLAPIWLPIVVVVIVLGLFVPATVLFEEARRERVGAER